MFETVRIVTCFVYSLIKTIKKLRTHKNTACTPWTLVALPDILDQRLQEIRHATETNEEARQLLQIIQNGWPPQRDQLPSRVRLYFSFRDTLSYDNGLIVKRERIFIPFPARAQIKAQLHSAHLDYDSMLRRAHGTMFWIGMSNDIKQLADNCDVCQQTKPCNSKEPLQKHAEGRTPWEKCVDLFEFNQKY